MKRVMLISAGFLLVMVGFVSADSESTTVKLSFTKSRSVFKLTWPIKFETCLYSFKNPSPIYGTDVSIKTQRKGKKIVVRLNCEGSSGIKPKLYKSKPLLFNISGTLGEKKTTLPLILDKIYIPRRSGNLCLKTYPGWAMKGSFSKKIIYLIDANVDGQFNTSGQDYIAIGSTSAIKLRKQTSINGKFYNISVTNDGSELTFEEVKPEKLCKVTLKKGFRGWQVLALSNAEGTYNIAAKKCAILPAGEYKVDYGLYGKNSLYLDAGGQFNPQLNIRENNANMINIGAPFSLSFTAKILNKKVTVNPLLSIVGCYGETYRFKSSRKPNRPAVAIFADKKMVNSGKMDFG